MAGGSSPGLRRTELRMRTLRALVRDTQRALSEVAVIVETEAEISYAVQEVGSKASQPTALVILGRTAQARARLLHCLLGRTLLPDPPPVGCRWLRVQYGGTRQAHLTLGNSEFELIEELECNKRPWDTLPPADLIRQDTTDLATVLDLELNNNFLKENIRIIIPPDVVEANKTATMEELKSAHSELYAKRTAILKHFNPIYLYAIDSIGKNVFSENICDRMSSSRSEEDFWSTCSMYYMTRSMGDEGKNDHGCEDHEKTESSSCNHIEVGLRIDNDSVLCGENCLDLQLIKEINPTSQVFFVLFSDSVDLENESDRTATEEPTKGAAAMDSDGNLEEANLVNSNNVEYLLNNGTGEEIMRCYEEQCLFMNELMDQWELVATQPPKSNIKDNWLIIDDREMLSVPENKSVAQFVSKTSLNATESISKNCNKTKEESKEIAKSKGNGRLVRNRNVFLSKISRFATMALQSYVLEYCTKLSEVHVRLLQKFILASFDLAREMQVVPKKIQYVAHQEQQLYEIIHQKFREGDKKQELVQIMQEVLHEMKNDVGAMDWSVDDLPCHQDGRFVASNSVFYDASQRSSSPAATSAVTTCSEGDTNDVEQGISFETYNFDDYEIIDSIEEAPSDVDTEPQAASIPVENEADVFSVNSSVVRFGARLIDQSSGARCMSNTQISVKQASLDVQKTVLSKLSRKISIKLVKFVDCLRDSYFGTLQRCLESLEASCREELGGRPATEAMRQLLSAARQVDLQACASFSVLRSLLDSLRRLFHRLRLVSGGVEASACCPLSPLWRRHVAMHTVHSLSASRLARVISSQILERLGAAHERYQSALATLETALNERLHHTEDAKLAIRKKFAPGFARLCLESTSMCDLVLHGAPELGREIGRGQYGVVYACRGAWAHKEPCAVKSVLPADERHFNELAMEFFYTRSIPEHPRIVRLFGSLVERHPGGGPTVLLVSERRARDLHCAVRAGLALSKRMRISLDIVEGIRYLHSLGLVHRDIKMKNVLLDAADRASLTDLGFLSPGALMSGSVVGTPVHMAPELVTGDYDASVDVYAFGILFWYVCAGNIRLPSAFETFQNKEQLWSKVRRGLRPERLPHFTEPCWRLMESCWASEPSQRALLGDVQPLLEAILQDALQEELTTEASAQNDCARSYAEDSLHMTGLDEDV